MSTALATSEKEDISDDLYWKSREGDLGVPPSFGCYTSFREVGHAVKVPPDFCLGKIIELLDFCNDFGRTFFSLNGHFRAF
jgi:hypothetical protein